MLFRSLYFENPEFGFYFLRLASNRLLHSLSLAEEKLAEQHSEHHPSLATGPTINPA